MDGASRVGDASYNDYPRIGFYTAWKPAKPLLDDPFTDRFVLTCINSTTPAITPQSARRPIANPCDVKKDSHAKS
ncbi:hypothetical protein HMPREF0645_0189 [Hallella bergensis DSM 17361]|uniref:Uncharacterized protein n=1 Tax=Hallella bergensis DSM 17361 TaxID=585502 RepID=D1PTA4_9BACT|nr:hypothetical protein [Hallella bergensis]EFA45406.1 hypothetical protein HMPREF0645_0189 [Hallella bergensis DSM 17361]